jgi:putative FmdB family regulatory protein
MPLYEYECDACGKRFEVIRKFSDPELDTCTQCGKGPVHRLLSSPAIQFKGTGWYITDYSAKGKTGADSSAAKPEAKKAESGSSETPAAKTDTSSTPSSTKSSSSET